MIAQAYVLVTPVRDEAATIGLTIESVLRQTVRPVEWVIVSDESSDDTDSIVSAYSSRHSWLRLIRVSRPGPRDFGAVVRNTELGISRLESSDYQYIGLLDGDVAFQPDYFVQLMRRFEARPTLGLAGGVVVDPGMERHIPRNRLDVPGATQFFRRECFESLGGLIAVPEGGWDALTCAVARLRGFDTRLFVDLQVQHLKPRNNAQGSRIRRKLQMGVRDYAIGYHPAFEFVKCVGRTMESPMFIGAAAWWVGYCIAPLRRTSHVVPKTLKARIRSEQVRRIGRYARLPRHLTNWWVERVSLASPSEPQKSR